MTPLAGQVETLLRQAMATALPEASATDDPVLRSSEHADFQANGVLGLARRLRADPRELAERVARALPDNDLVRSCEVSGPGFLNLTVSDDALVRQLGARLATPRLGIPPAGSSIVTVVEYSQPNIAKELHVGHLRSTIIGDALARVLEFLGAQVIRQNHLGDWGTQFGMLIQYLDEHPELAWHHGAAAVPGSLSQLNDLYRAARERFDADPGFADRARERVVALQSGDPPTVASWRAIVSESTRSFNQVYQRLGVLLTDADAVGESFYNPFLHQIAEELEERGIAIVSNGALCVFFDGIQGPDGQPVPLIVRKRDGGFGYAATDLAAIRYRVRELGARRLLYVVDSRQALHFKMVFETARRAGWLTQEVSATHVTHGAVLGLDGKPFRTRAGVTVRLLSLLDQAIAKARQTVAEKSPQLDDRTLDGLATIIGTGAVRYAELSTGRDKDYVFDVDRMVALDGNTSVYLQYAHARVRSILRRLPDGAAEARPHAGAQLAPAERALALALDDFAGEVPGVAERLEPHRLCARLYEVGRAFTDFYESCPVLQAEPGRQRDNRVLLCRLTGDTLELGLGLLGIAPPERL